MSTNNIDKYIFKGNYVQISDIKINVALSHDEEIEFLEEKLKKILKVKNKSALPEYVIRRRSIDARKGVQIIFSVLIKEDDLSQSKKNYLLRNKFANRVSYPEKTHEDAFYVYHHAISQGTFSTDDNSSINITSHRITSTLITEKKINAVVIGMGPAGLFAALELARSGYPPTIIERGKAVEDRQIDFNLLREKGILNPESNAQFGEGGAGTFSDGKLTSRMKNSYVDLVLRNFVNFGADESILYDQRPHMGSDCLPHILKNLRHELLKLGVKILFSTRAEGLQFSDGKLTAVKTNRGEIKCNQVIVAIGHSARDSYVNFYNNGLILENKPFAMGFRIEHRQEFINKQQYGKYFNSPLLGSANYSVVVHPFKEELRLKEEKERAIYSFCMCPGGEVIQASSFPGMLCVNGMSNLKRNSGIANSALLCSIDERDYGDELFAGMKFQERIEKICFKLGGKNNYAPAELCEDYLNKNTSGFGFADFSSTFKPGLKFVDLHQVYPKYINDYFIEGLKLIDNIYPNYSKNALLIAAETRSSAPLRMIRNKETLESIGLEGVYPAGEGAGYAGGIVSSAVDGIKVSRALIDKWK